MPDSMTHTHALHLCRSRSQLRSGGHVHVETSQAHETTTRTPTVARLLA